MRETDPTISPVARLRDTLQTYQKARDSQRQQLQDTLYSMDADRLHSLKRRANNLKPTSHGPTADAKTSCQLMRLEAEKEMLEKHITEVQKRQFFWYRDLWNTIKREKNELTDVAHFIFDFIKKVLEYGEEFTRDMYYSMLSKIENFEYSAVVSKLVVKMLDGIEGIRPSDLVDWFKKNRGTSPPKALVEELNKGMFIDEVKEFTSDVKAGGEQDPDRGEQARGTFLTGDA